MGGGVTCNSLIRAFSGNRQRAERCFHRSSTSRPWLPSSKRSLEPVERASKLEHQTHHTRNNQVSEPRCPRWLRPKSSTDESQRGPIGATVERGPGKPVVVGRRIGRRRIGRRLRHATGLHVFFVIIVAALGALTFSAGPRLSALVAAAVLFGFGIGVAFTTIYTVAGQRVPARARGVAFGFLTTASLSGLALSPIVSGLLGSFSMRGVFVADAAGLVAVAWTVRRLA